MVYAVLEEGRGCVLGKGLAMLWWAYMGMGW